MGERKLCVVCESVHTAEYLQRNGVFPSSIVLSVKGFKDVLPYLSADTDVLVLISGLTSFTVQEVYTLLADVAELKKVGNLNKVVIMSNIKFGNIPYDYYYYKGDLFFGSVVLISNNKEYPVETSKGKKGIFKKKSTDSIPKNVVAFSFKRFNNKAEHISLYGQEPKSINIVKDAVEDGIVLVDMFKDEDEDD